MERRRGKIKGHTIRGARKKIERETEELVARERGGLGPATSVSPKGTKKKRGRR